MKLIDADKTAKNVYNRIEEDLCSNTSPYVCDELEVCLPKEDYEYLRGLNDAQDCAVKTINEEPIVEAIPIEWMKRWYSNRGWMHNYEFERMLNDWEKENE